MIVNCSACGGTLKYDPVTQKMKCNSCKNLFSTELAELTGNTSEVKIFRCQHCNSEFIACKSDAVAYCPLCGYHDIKLQKVEKEFNPDFVAPFVINRQQAAAAINARMASEFFAPRSIKYFSDSMLSALYIPFWCKDFNFNSDLVFETATGSAKKTRIESKNSHVHTNFENFLVNASSHFNNSLINNLAPWHIKDNTLLKYNNSDLSDCFVDRYNNDTVDIEAATFSKAALLIAKAVSADKNESFLNLTEHNSSGNCSKNDYILLPVWILNSRFNNNTYSFAVNALTGKVSGVAPVDINTVKIKCLVLAAILAAVVVPLLCFMSPLAYKPMFWIWIVIVSALFAFAGYRSFTKFYKNNPDLYPDSKKTPIIKNQK